MMNSPGMHYFSSVADASIEILCDSWRTAYELYQFNQITRPATIAGALLPGETGRSLQCGYPLFHIATLVAFHQGRE